MIVMTCAPQDRLHIGDDTQVDILEVHPRFVRLAISTQSPIPAYTEETIYFEQQEPSDAFA